MKRSYRVMIIDDEESARRLMRAAYKTIEPNIKSGYDIIFVARAAIIGCKEPEVEEQLKRALKGTEILTGNNNE